MSILRIALLSRLRSLLLGAVAFLSLSAAAVSYDCATWADAVTNLKAGRSIRLTSDMVCLDSDGKPAATTTLSGLSQTIDLNGHTLTLTNQTSQLFIVHTNTAVTVKGSGTVRMAVATCSANGAFAHLDGHLTISGAIVFNNFSVKKYGSVLEVGSTGQLTISGATFDTCKANNATTPLGGAIYSKGRVIIQSGTLFKACQSGKGAAVYADGGSVTVSGGRFLDCTASSGAVIDGASTAYFYIYGGAFESTTTPLASGNVARTVITGGAFKGGLPSGYSPLGGYEAHDVSGAAAAVAVVGRKGTVSSAGGQLTGGLFAFDPTHSDYANLFTVATGLQALKGQRTPTNWKLSDHYVAPESDSLAVTTTSDVYDEFDHVTSLREALFTAALVSSNETAVITFDATLFADATAVEVGLTNAPTIAIATPVKLQGPKNAQKAVTLRATAPSGVSFHITEDGVLDATDLSILFEPAADCGAASSTPSSGTFLSAYGGFSFTRCAFTGAGTKKGCLIHSHGSSDNVTLAGFTRCSFAGEHCGIVRLHGSKRHYLETCTFADIVSSTEDGILDWSSTADAVIANCTFTACTAKNAALALHGSAKGTNYVVNSLFLGNDPVDLLSTATNVVLCAVRYGSIDASYATLRDTSAIELPNQVFASTTKTRTVDGVAFAYRPLASNGEVTRDGCYVQHSADWANVAYGSELYGSASKALCGDISLALAQSVLVDILGNSVSTCPSPGSCATPKDCDNWKTPGAIEVTSASGGRTDDYDGVISLSDALAYAASAENVRSDAGDCTVTFSAKLYSGQRPLTIAQTTSPAAIAAFTNGTLAIQGPTGGSRLVLDGVDAYRLMHVAAGNRVRVYDVTFTRGRGAALGSVGLSAGGAIYNEGTLTLDNCAFTSCVAGDPDNPKGYSDGGALATAAGGTSVVVRCCFSACSAARGGAVATYPGGATRLASTTLYGNRAYGTATTNGGRGGALAVLGDGSETVLVNVTLTANSAMQSGGGVYAEKGGTLYAVHAILVGNAAESLRATDDLAAEEGLALAYSRYGRAQLGANEIEDAHVASGCPVPEVFAATSLAGAAQVTNATVAGVEHGLFPLIADAGFECAYVRADELFANVSFGSASATDTALVGKLRVAKTKDLWSADEEDVSGSSPFTGATRRTDESPVKPGDSAKNPLLVKTATRAALATAILNARENPSLASNGVLTITFATDVTEILFDQELPIADGDFADTPLVIDGAGAVAFRPAAGVSTRFLTIDEDNDVRLAGLTLSGGAGTEIGGAVYVYAAAFTASNCTFASNRPVDAGDGTYGGAVGLEDDTAAGTFLDCTFTDNDADFGTAIYRDDTHLVLIRTAFSDPIATAVGLSELHERLERDGAVFGYFDSIERVLAYVAKGDTIYLISEDAPDPDDIVLPGGVTVVDETQANGPFLAALAVQMSGSAPKYYTVVQTPTSVGYAVKTAANAAADDADAQAVAESCVLDAAEVVFDSSDDPNVVTATPANVIPGLTYGLGFAAAPSEKESDYAVGKWVTAGTDGTLAEPLTATKPVGAGYYRLVVK